MHSSCVPLQGTASCKLIATEQARVWISFNVVAFDVAMSLALVAETSLANAAAPKPASTPIHLTRGMIFDVSQHFVLLHVDWKGKVHHQVVFIFIYG